MAIRTNTQAVTAAVKTEDGADVSPYIRTANALTDKVVAADSAGALSTAILFEIETYLAAHFYACFDPQYTEKKTGDASATFQGHTEMRLDATTWGQQAMMLDSTGFLAKQSRDKHQLQINWLGLAPSSQTEYRDRD